MSRVSMTPGGEMEWKQVQKGNESRPEGPFAARRSGWKEKPDPINKFKRLR